MMLALLLVAQAAGQEPLAHEGAPGARLGVAGLSGFSAVSRIDFGDRQNRLTAVYQFPDRVRWHFEAYDARRSEHLYLYRFGERVHELRSGASSVELAREEANAVLLQMELRRAALFWPDGFEWAETEGGSREATVYRDSCCRRDPIGSLRATMDADGRPREVSVRAPDGALRESLAIRSWQELGGRRWPREMDLDQGVPLRETVESVETRLHYHDLSFLPGDRRPAGRASAGGPRILSTDLIPVTYRERALAGEPSWPEALERARAWNREAQAELGPQGIELDPVPTFELDREGRPILCLLRLAHAQNPPPAGWRTVDERPGLVVALGDIRELDRAHLDLLFASVPDGVSPGRPYLRLEERGQARVQVLLPLEPLR